MEASKRTESEIANSTWPKKPRHPFKKLCAQRNMETQIHQRNVKLLWHNLLCKKRYINIGDLSWHPLINLQCKPRCLLLSFALFPVAYSQSGNPCEHRVWGGGTGEITISNILNLDFNSCQLLTITYCTVPLIQSLIVDIIRSLMFYLIAIYVRCLFKTWTYTNYAIILWKMISMLIRAQFGILFSWSSLSHRCSEIVKASCWPSKMPSYVFVF